jgi:hypothetical protein
MARILLVILLSLFINLNNNSLFSQEHSGNQNAPKGIHGHKNELVGFVGATYIFKSGFVLPTVGIEYVRKINSNFGVGLISEFEIGSHIISINEEMHEEIEVTRESAFLILPALYYINGHFVFSAGYGIEFEKSENLGLFKLTAMYVLELKNEAWIVVPNISWDHTSRFDGLVYGFSIARHF